MTPGVINPYGWEMDAFQHIGSDGKYLSPDGFRSGPYLYGLGPHHLRSHPHLDAQTEQLSDIAMRHGVSLRLSGLHGTASGKDAHRTHERNSPINKPQDFVLDAAPCFGRVRNSRAHTTRCTHVLGQYLTSISQRD